MMNWSNQFNLLIIIYMCYRSIAQATTYTCNTSASCGCSKKPATLNKIIGGEDAQSKTWGWSVSILINGNLQCGGSILSDTWILTAAHCIPIDCTSISVYAGSIYRFSGTQTRSVSTAYPHPAYNSSGFIHDIALLQLKTPLNMTDPNINAICLPSESAETLAAGEWPPANTSVVTVGWGRIAEGFLMTSYTLQQVTMKTISWMDPTCTPVIVDWNLHFCAGVDGGGKGTCQGDSGGAVMMFNETWYAVGVVNYAIGCARANYSGVYARVAYYRNWLDSVMNGDGTGISLPTSRITNHAAYNDYHLLLIYFMLTIVKSMLVA